MTVVKPGDAKMKPVGLWFSLHTALLSACTVPTTTTPPHYTPPAVRAYLAAHRLCDPATHLPPTPAHLCALHTAPAHAPHIPYTHRTLPACHHTHTFATAPHHRTHTPPHLPHHHRTATYLHDYRRTHTAHLPSLLEGYTCRRPCLPPATTYTTACTHTARTDAPHLFTWYTTRTHACFTRGLPGRIYYCLLLPPSACCCIPCRLRCCMPMQHLDFQHAISRRGPRRLCGFTTAFHLALPLLLHRTRALACAGFLHLAPPRRCLVALPTSTSDRCSLSGLLRCSALPFVCQRTGAGHCAAVRFACAATHCLFYVQVLRHGYGLHTASWLLQHIVHNALC